MTLQFKDFEHLQIQHICEEFHLLRLGTMQKNPHDYEMPQMDQIYSLRLNADNSLPVNIGVSSKEGKEPTPVHLEAHRVIPKIGNM
jgi:hypothetical protein